jgi:hypothetical protein
MIVINWPKLIAHFIERCLFGMNLDAITLDQLSENSLSAVQVKGHHAARTSPAILRYREENEFDSVQG